MVILGMVYRFVYHIKWLCMCTYDIHWPMATAGLCGQARLRQPGAAATDGYRPQGSLGWCCRLFLRHRNYGQGCVPVSGLGLRDTWLSKPCFFNRGVPAFPADFVIMRFWEVGNWAMSMWNHPVTTLDIHQWYEDIWGINIYQPLNGMHPE